MKQVVIMPGGFHPFHAGHYALYKQAQDAFPGADVYVAATNDTSTRPFPFALKEKLAKLAGVNPGKFIQVKSPFRAMEIVGNMDPADTQLIFVRSQKDADKPPQAGVVKKDGQPAYLQLLKGQSELAPMSQHAYMAYLPTVEFGPGMTSATEIRNAWPTLNEKRKTALVMSLYPKTQTNPALAANVVKMLDTAMGVEELNEFAPDGFNGDDDGEGFDSDMADMVYKDGIRKGVSLADAKTAVEAIAINLWHKQAGGIYKQYFFKGFIEGRKEKIRHDNKQYNLNLQLMKDGSISRGEQGVAEAGITRRGFLKGAGAAAAAGAAGKASAIAGAFPTPSHQAAMYKAAADSNAAQARADAAAKAKADAERLKTNTELVDKEQRVNHHKLNEFAPDDSGGSRKFIPWTEFIEQVKQIVSKDFSVKENVVKSTIKARFIPHDPMEYGPTMLYSYYEARAGRNKGAVSTRGSIQVGKYTLGGLYGQPKDQLLTGFHLLKGHPFERHFDLTFDNIYKIANIIMGNTEGAYQMQPQQGVAEGKIQYGVLDHDNVNLIIDKSESKPDGIYSFRGILFKVKGGKVTHYATDGKILQAMGRFNTQIGSYATNTEAKTILKSIKESVAEDYVAEKK